MTIQQQADEILARQKWGNIPETVRYTVTVTVERAIRAEEWDDAYPANEHIDTYTNAAGQRELEREVMSCLSRLDGDCDAETMDAELLDADNEIWKGRV